MSKAELKIEYYKNGNLHYEHHHINGVIHRENGPAFIFYYDSTHIYCEEYYLNGERHREDGPAYISYYENGDVYREEYYINGERLTEEEWYNALSTKQKVSLLYGESNE